MSEEGDQMDIAKCVRIFEPEPDDDFVIKREAAIKDLRATFSKKRNISELMALGSGACEIFRESPAIPDPLAAQVEAAIKKQSASFVQDGRDLEISVCATAAVVQLVEVGAKARNSWSVSDVVAVALWSAGSFLPSCNAPKLEEFRVATVDAARNRILNTSLETRVRHDVPALGAFGGEENTPESFTEAVAPTIDALRSNAALDREELDLLWWVLGGTSEIFGRPVQSLSQEARAVATGVELGALMRALPSQSHRNLPLRGLNDAAPLPLPKLLAALGGDRSVIAASFKNESLIDDAPLVFPLLSALRRGEGSGPGGDVPRSLSEWGARALLERAVLQIQHRDHRNK